MNKTITAILFLLLVLPSKAQEEFVVRGFLERPSILPSRNFQRSMFCYFQGNFVMARQFFTFRVDYVISGTFYNSINEISKPPFNIMVGLFNEAVVLDSRAYYTLQLKRFPHTNYFYVDSLSQVYPNENFWERLAERNERHQQNIDILTNGTLYERRELLERLENWWNFRMRYVDYRYIPYLLPYMTSRELVIYYWVTVGGGYTHREEQKGLYSDFVFNYIRRTLPFVLPNRATTDSIGWHKWYESLFSGKECFTFVKFATSQSEFIANLSERNRFSNSLDVPDIRYFITDMSNRVIYFGTFRQAYTVNMDTNELIDEISFPRLDNTSDIPSTRESFSIRNNEIPRFNSFYNDIDLLTLNNGVFRRQSDKTIPLNLRHSETGHVLPHLIVHSGDDFFVFVSQNPNGYSRLKVGKINRKGEWIIEPKILYNQRIRHSFDIGAFSFYQSDKNETTFVFSDRTYGRTSRHTNSGENWGAVIVYRLNANLEITNSVVLKMEFPHTHFFFRRTQLLKNGNTYLLLTETTGGGVNMRIHYRLLNNDLSPKTDFIQLFSKRIPANTNTNWHLLANPITTSEGFLISWNDYELTENLTRSVLIDATSGRQSDIINISNQRISDIFNIEFDENNVDIFIVDTDGNLIRKRINKSEFGL